MLLQESLVYEAKLHAAVTVRPRHNKAQATAGVRLLFCKCHRKCLAAVSGNLISQQPMFLWRFSMINFSLV